MPLDDLNRELYKGNSSVIPSHMHETSEYDPRISAQNQSPFNQDEMWQKEDKEVKRKRKKKTLIISASIFSVIVLIAGGLYLFNWWKKNAFHQDRVMVSFEGPKEADSTQPTKYVIHYKNNNRVTLNNAEIQLSYSENFQPTDNLNLKYFSPGSSRIFIGDIKPMSEGTADLNGIFYAPKDFPVFLNASLRFTPSNGTAELSMENQTSIKITAAPVTLSILSPKQAANGDEVEYDVNYSNLDIRRMNDVQIRVDFPQGFQMTSAEPRPSEKESYWYIGNLESNQGGKIIIKGRLFGDSDETKPMIASLGRNGSDNNFVVFSRQESNTKIVSPVLAVVQTLQNHEDNIIKAGDNLTYKISFKNTGSVGLRDAIITAEVKGKVLDFSKLIADKGSYNDKTGIITWKASDVPALSNIAPNAAGEVFFSIPVKSVITPESKLDKNLVVSSIAKIDSPDIPTPVDSNKVIGSNRMELKLASKAIFETRAYFKDAKIKNTGPIPMETGSETTFAVHWTVMNTSNDISGVKVVASLPSGVRWTGNIYPKNEKILYNERTNQIVWDAGEISAGAGLLDPAREIEFQVGVTPQANQVGEPVVLVNKSEFVAQDKFTGSNISLSNEQKNSELPEDQTVGYTNGKVAK